MSEGSEAGDAARGDAEASEMWQATYQELKRLARARLRRCGPMTLLDTTALVNESFVRFVAARQPQAGDRNKFLAYASRVMRSVVVDLARERAAEIHGGGLDQLTLTTGIGETQPENDPLAVHEALLSLEQVDARLAQIVQMRYFGGLTELEIAAALDLGERTVRRDWEKARALLRAMLE